MPANICSSHTCRVCVHEFLRAHSLLHCFLPSFFLGFLPSFHPTFLSSSLPFLHPSFILSFLLSFPPSLLLPFLYLPSLANIILSHQPCLHFPLLPYFVPPFLSFSLPSGFQFVVSSLAISRSSEPRARDHRHLFLSCKEHVHTK